MPRSLRINTGPEEPMLLRLMNTATKKRNYIFTTAHKFGVIPLKSHGFHWSTKEALVGVDENIHICKIA